MIKRTIAIYWSVPRWFTRDVLLPFLITRVALTVVAWLGFRFLSLPSAYPLSWELGADGVIHHTSAGVPAAHPFINMWSRWDSGWYLTIARSGYNFAPGKPSSAAFFPLYPAAVRALHDVLFLPKSEFWYLLAGIAVSNLSLIVALAYLYLLIRLDYSSEVASHAVLCLLVFPASFFFSSVYSESTFLALSVASFYYARQTRWLTACLLAAFASLCRSQGIILLLPLLVEYFLQRNFKWRLVRWNIVALFLVPAALFIFAAYMKWSFGSWSILFAAQQPWGRRLLAPWYTLPWVIRHTSTASDWLDISFFAFLVVGSVAAIPRIRRSYVAYLWTAVIFFSSWGMLGSVPRFAAVVFPLFISLGLLIGESRPFRIAYLTISSILGALLFVIHSQWQWVA